MKRQGKAILIILILSMGIAMIFFSFEENQKRFVKYLDSFQSKGKEVVEIGYIPGNGIRYINNRYMLWNGERISIADETGKILWERTFLLDDPVLEVTENRIGIFDKARGEAMVFDVNGVLLSHIKEEKPIFHFKAGKDGSIIHIKEEGRQIIRIYDKSGELLDQIIFTKEFPIDYRLEEQTVVLTLLVLQGDGVSTKAVRYSGEEEKDLYSLDDRIILDWEKIGRDTLLVSDTGVFMEHKGDLKWGRELPLFKDLAVDGEDIYVLYGDNLRIMDPEGSTILQETYGMEYNRLHTHGKYIILAGDKDILVLQHMEPVASYSLNSKIVEIQSQFNDLVVTTENGVSIMRIVDKEVEEGEM